MMDATAKNATSKTRPAQDKNMIEKLLSLTTESWNDIFQTVSVIAAAVAFVALVGTALSGRKVNKEQAERVLNLEREVAEARRQQAAAERDLEELRHRQEPRKLSAEDFAKAFRDFVGKDLQRESIHVFAHVLYQPNDTEAYAFALNIKQALIFAGFDVPENPTPLKRPPTGDPTDDRMPDMVWYGAGRGVTLSGDSKDLEEALVRAFNACGVEARIGRMKSSTFLIVVGPKP